jgi:hypothetical protein
MVSLGACYRSQDLPEGIVPGRTQGGDSRFDGDPTMYRSDREGGWQFLQLLPRDLPAQFFHAMFGPRPNARGAAESGKSLGRKQLGQFGHEAKSAQSR